MSKEEEKKRDEDKKAFQALSRRVMHLHHLWHEYAVLFRQPAIETKLDLMNSTAPTFFHLVQETWLDQLFLESENSWISLVAMTDRRLVLNL